MTSLTKLLANTISLLAVIIINYLSNTGAFNSTTIGELSKKYDTLFTPAGYAFSIWGVIYLMLIASIFYQWRLWLREKKEDIISQIGLWFTIANLANAAWVIAWLTEHIELSVLIMLVLLFSLIKLIRRLNMERWDAPVSIIFFIWWPICLYTGWIILATVANISALLVSMEWKRFFLSESTWTIVMILISAIIYLLLIYKRNMREAALVGVWGLTAIAYRQWQEHTNIVVVSLLAAFVLFSYASYHGYKNRATSPLKKLMK